MREELELDLDKLPKEIKACYLEVLGSKERKASLSTIDFDLLSNLLGFAAANNDVDFLSELIDQLCERTKINVSEDYWIANPSLRGCPLSRHRIGECVIVQAFEQNDRRNPACSQAGKPVP